MLTAMQVKKAEIREKPYKLSDAGGLYLLVKPGGGKYWRYKYRFAGKEKTYALGTAEDISLATAREAHQKARQLVKEGIDPSQQKQKEKIQRHCDSEHSFQNIAKLWHEGKLKGWDAKHAAKIWRSLELHIFPRFGQTPINEIKPKEILDTIRLIESRGNTDISHRVLQRCSAVFQYAICADLADYNPASDLKGALVAHKTEHFPTIESHELPEFFKRLEVSRTSPLNKLAIKLLILTFARQCELRKAKWQEFDLREKVWRVPAENTKMKREHIVPLSRQAISLLEEIKTLPWGGEYVFPTQNRQKNPHMSEGTITRVLKEMGYKGLLVGHGFRAIATTVLNEESPFDDDVIERQMQHKEANKVRAAYHRAQYIEKRTEMMQWWADYIQALVK